MFLKAVMYVISAAMGLVLFAAIQSTAQAQAQEHRIYAEPTTSRIDADIIYYEVDYDGEKWYIGECFGDIVMRADRMRLYKSDHKIPGVHKVVIVYTKFDADTIICIK